MKGTRFPGVLTLTAFAAYLYLLIKVILYKGGHVDLHTLLRQLRYTLQDPERIFWRSRNVIPFHEIKRDLHNLSLSDPFLNINLTGNVLAFMPFGFLLPLVFPHWRWSMFKVLVFSFMLSCAFECTQLVLAMGTFDVDDMILNTAGGVAGYMLYRIGARLTGRTQSGGEARHGGHKAVRSGTAAVEH